MRGLRSEIVSGVLRWVGRGLAVVLCLFWGAFFVEHLASWFDPRRGSWPPAWVWVGQGLHLVMLAGLALIAWKERAGAALTVIGTVAFFGWIGMLGSSPLPLLNLLPVLALGASWATAPVEKPAETRD